VAVQSLVPVRAVAADVVGNIHFADPHTEAGCSSVGGHHHNHCSPEGDTDHTEVVGRAGWDHSYMVDARGCRAAG
jgi:hypothetical protein